MGLGTGPTLATVIYVIRGFVTVNDNSTFIDEEDSDDELLVADDDFVFFNPEAEVDEVELDGPSSKSPKRGNARRALEDYFEERQQRRQEEDYFENFSIPVDEDQ